MLPALSIINSLVKIVVVVVVFRSILVLHAIGECMSSLHVVDVVRIVELRSATVLVDSAASLPLSVIYLGPY